MLVSCYDIASCNLQPRLCGSASLHIINRRRCDMWRFLTSENVVQLVPQLSADVYALPVVFRVLFRCYFAAISLSLVIADVAQFVAHLLERQPLDDTTQ